MSAEETNVAPTESRSYTSDEIKRAKAKFMAQCDGPRARCPIEVNTVGAIIDDFLGELEKIRNKR